MQRDWYYDKTNFPRKKKFFTDGIDDNAAKDPPPLYEAHTLEELEAMPTLTVGQADDLKIETFNTRVWLSRCTVEDGEPWNNKVTLESLVGGRWIETDHLQAR